MNLQLQDLRVHDIVEFFNDPDYRSVLADEWDYDLKTQKLATDEDSMWYPFQCVSKVWREDQNGNYELIFTKEVIK